MARIRTFIAVALSDRIRQGCIDLQKELAQTAGPVKWVTEENFHITLHFLGEVNELDLVSICRVVQKKSQRVEPFRLTIGSLGCFPTPRRPKVLWAGVTEGLKELTKLHSSMEEPLQELGCYRREERQYSPHLTLGRIESKNAAEEVVEPGKITGQADANEFSWTKVLKDYEEWQAGYCAVEEVLVMTSEHRRGGPVYTAAARAPLGRKSKD